MADFETRVRVTAKPQGFDKLTQESNKLKAAQQQSTRGFQTASKAVQVFQQAVDKAFKAFQTKKAKGEVEGLTETIKDLEEQLSATAARQLELHRAMMATEKGSEVYKKLTDEMSRLDDEAQNVQKTITLVERAFKGQIRATQEAANAARQAKGAFSQGFMQGAGMGEFFQRGPGMWKQAAGRMLGRGAVGIPRGVAGGLAQMPFAGSAGLLQALQSIPFAGALTGPLQAGLGFGQQAISYQQQRLQMAPFLMGGGAARGIAAARTAGQRRADLTAGASIREARMGAMLGELPAGAAERLLEAKVQEEAGPEGGMFDIGRKVARDRVISRMGGRKAALTRAEAAARLAEGTAAEEKARGGLGARRQAMGAQGAAEARRALFAPVRGAGLELMGAGEQEALQFAGGVAQRGGGSLAELQKTGLLRGGMAAQTAFGVGPEVTGAFLGAARRGGVTGGVGPDTMAQAIGDAMSLGLQGSEINDYLETMAEGIDQWRQTGISLNRDSMRDVAGAFAGTGLGVVQGQRVARGIQARAGAIATGGPQTAIDMLLMQSLGGFKGGGIEEFQAARKKMAGGDFQGPEIQNFLQTLTQATGGGAAGEAALQAALGQLGITATPQMAEQLLAAGRGGPQSPAQQKAIAEFQAQARAGAAGAPGTAQGLETIAKEFVSTMGPNLRRQANIQNQQLDVGSKLVSVMQDFEQTTTTTAGTVASFKDQIKLASETALEFAKAMQWFVKLAQEKGAGGALGEVMAP